MTSMTGWTMFRLLTANDPDLYPDLPTSVGLARWTGWEIWNEFVRLRMHLDNPQGSEYNKQYKYVLSSLETLGYIKKFPPTQGRPTAARSRWAPTQKGQDWWLEKGVDEHFNDDEKPKPVDSDAYLDRWYHVTKRPIPQSAWNDLLKRYKRGELNVRFTETKK